jgi:hypothetical protein
MQQLRTLIEGVHDKTQLAVHKAHVTDGGSEYNDPRYLFPVNTI